MCSASNQNMSEPLYIIELLPLYQYYLNTFFPHLDNSTPTDPAYGVYIVYTLLSSLQFAFRLFRCIPSTKLLNTKKKRKKKRFSEDINTLLKSIPLLQMTKDGIVVQYYVLHNIFVITLFAQLYSRVGSLLACDHFISRRGEG